MSEWCLAEGEAAAYAEPTKSPSLFHYLVTQTGTRKDAADLLQETFLRIHRAGERLGDAMQMLAIDAEGERTRQPAAALPVPRLRRTTKRIAGLSPSGDKPLRSRLCVPQMRLVPHS